jgi:hypothetical protein
MPAESLALLLAAARDEDVNHAIRRLASLPCGNRAIKNTSAIHCGFRFV